MKRLISGLLTCIMAFCCVGAFASETVVSKEATSHTQQQNASWYERLDFTDMREIANAERGLIEETPEICVTDASGEAIWSTEVYATLPEQAPDTVNPSLWRHTQLNAKVGLFEVCDGIYQVRGYDMSNATFIRTDNGWIVFDPLMCVENMQAALQLMEKHFGKLDVKAILYSHSHVDHFGGVKALVQEEDVADASLSVEEQLLSGKTLIIAPEEFLDHAISENIYAGTAMARRAQYQYGPLLEQGEIGSLSIGIGLGQSRGTVSLIAPTVEITENNLKMCIDGLEVQFHLTPGTEAPTEMNAYFPAYRALWMAENCTGTLHNLYTLRGAQVRDASKWAAYILEAQQLFAAQTDVIFQSHNWPHWGEEINEYLTNTALIYKFIHDQTLHYINLGYTATEISNMLELPEKLAKVWYTRQYYGTLSHNIKAVYQRYIGWYDANPVNLNLLTPTDTANKLVEYLGSPAAVLEKAKADFEKGEYQWVAQITKELVYADPTNQEARDLCADALEQLGYQAESGAWRNAYLMGALELRMGNQAVNAPAAAKMGSVMQAMSVEMMLDYIAILTDTRAACQDDLSMKLVIADTGESFYVRRMQGILIYYPCRGEEAVEATVTCARLQLLGKVNGMNTEVRIEGDETIVDRLLKYKTTFQRTFNVIEP